MPDLLETTLTIPDIGHGSCAIVGNPQAWAIVDTGPDGRSLVALLRNLTIESIDHLFISHPDRDHVGGLSLLVEQFHIRNIYLNSLIHQEGRKRPILLNILKFAERRGTRIHVGLTSTSPNIICGEVTIEIIGPSPLLAACGPEETYLDGHVLKPNTLSVVIRIVHQGCPVVLLPGDMDAFSLDHLLERQQNLESKILVFPHHGGSSGNNDDYAFAQKLVTAVKPELIAFSLHRNQHGNPKEEIMRGILDAAPNVQILCTQLSSKCCPEVFASDLDYLNDLPAKGRATKSCCGGTIRVVLQGEQTTVHPSRALHRQFVQRVAQHAAQGGHAGPLCLRSSPPVLGEKPEALV